MSEVHTKKNLNWLNVIFILGTPILAIALTILYCLKNDFNPWMILIFLLFYLATGISITAGYHRLFSHQSYQANNWVKAFFLFFGAGAFQNSVLEWAADHRNHHKFVDQNKDPYNIRRGFWWAHMGWIFFHDSSPCAFNKDLQKDPLVLFQHKHYLVIAIVSGLLLPTLLGGMFGSYLGGLAIGGLLRAVVVHHFTFFINSLCHMVGRQTYTDQNSARDSFFMAFLTYGEGYHNFHHQFQADYRNGIRWYQFDPTKWTIRTLFSMGAAKKLRRTDDRAILRAKMCMDQKRIKAKAMEPEMLKVLSETLENLQAKVENAQTQWKKLKADYQVYKNQKMEGRRRKMLKLRADLRLARLEFKYAHRQWKAYTRILLKQNSAW